MRTAGGPVSAEFDVRSDVVALARRAVVGLAVPGHRDGPGPQAVVDLVAGPGAAGEPIRPIRSGTFEEGVAPGVAPLVVGSEAAVDLVVVGAALDEVVAVIAQHHVG